MANALQRTYPQKRQFSVLEDNDPAGFKSGRGQEAKREAGIAPFEIPKRSPDQLARLQPLVGDQSAHAPPGGLVARRAQGDAGQIFGQASQDREAFARHLLEQVRRRHAAPVPAAIRRQGQAF